MSQSPLTIQFALVHYWSDTPEQELGASYRSEAGRSILAWMHSEGLLEGGKATDRLRVWVTDGICAVPLPVKAWRMSAEPSPFRRPGLFQAPVCLVGPALAEPLKISGSWELRVLDVGQWTPEEGLSEPVYQWQRNRVDIARASGSLFIIAPGDAGLDLFRCVVFRRNAAGETWAYTPEVRL